MYSVGRRPAATPAAAAVDTGEQYEGDRRSVAAAPILVERTEAGSDTDTATRATVRQMCRYIREGAADPQVQAAANYAARRFGAGFDSPDMLAWAVFWYVKHCLRFRNDEAGLFRLGESNQQDLLIAPAVLVRMQDPAEDCDGFTMLTAALCQVLKLPVVIVTVAADPADRSRWSHVFCMARIGADHYLPLDTSHGRHPGWMVPREHISRWQCWNLEGEPVSIPPPAPRSSSHLHGYVRGGRPSLATSRGVGDTATLDFPQVDANQPVIWENPVGDPAPWGGGQQIDWGGSSAGSGANWTQFLQGLATSTANLIGKIVAPPAFQQITRDPRTGEVISTTVRSSATPATALTTGAGSIAPALWIGGGILALLVISQMSKGHRS